MKNTAARFGKPFLIVVLSIMLAGTVVSVIRALDRAQERRDIAQFRKLSPADAKRRIGEMIAAKGPVYAWEFTKKVYADDGSVVFGNADGHAVAHYVGEAMYDRFGLARGLSNCDLSFAQGCMHGVVARMILKQGSDAAVAMGEICASYTDPGSCAHGAGHGIEDAMGRNFAESLRWCKKFPSTIVSDCIEGALMDDSWQWRRADVERAPWAVCEALDPEYFVACASAVGNYFAEARNDDEAYRYEPSMASDACKQAPRAVMKDICFQRLEQSIVRRTKGDPAAMFAQCSTIAADRRNECVVVANDFKRDQGTF